MNNRIASHINRIQKGAMVTFNNSLQELDVTVRIDVMMDLLVFDAKIQEQVVNSRAQSKVRHAPHIIVPDRGPSLLAPSFFPVTSLLTRSNPIAA